MCGEFFVHGRIQGEMGPEHLLADAVDAVGLISGHWMKHSCLPGRAD